MVDYSKFDNIVDSDDEQEAPKAAAPPSAPPSGGAYTPEQRAAAEAAANAAAAANWKPEADPRAEIERLKAEKRAAREAREAAAKAAGGGSEETAAPAPAVAPAPAAPAAPKGPMEQLTAAEATAQGIRDEAAAVTATLASLVVDDVDAVLKRVTLLNGQVGKLQGDLDMISIGELGEEERDAAKQRRKKLNVAVEDELMALAADTRKKVLAKKKELTA